MSKIDIKHSKKDRKYVNILDINILSTSRSELLNSLEKKIKNNSKFSVLTPNPEIVLASTKNDLLKEALVSSEFLIPDGVGLSYTSKFLYGKSLNIIPGRKLFMDLIELANKNALKVFLFGGWGNVSELAAQKLQITNYKLQIEYATGPRLNNDSTPATEVDKKLMIDAVDKINSFKPDILFVAFGAPKQEVWIMKNMNKINAKCFMGVGGTLRYIAGIVPFPPSWMEKAGLEWLFRLVTEPVRIIRIWNAVVVFSWKVFVSKLKFKQ
jgi:N-acetylglucosaminyldiphosphoundecaprenol N-acetyl-beta-D-mannosaminyltransferase